MLLPRSDKRGGDGSCAGEEGGDGSCAGKEGGNGSCAGEEGGDRLCAGEGSEDNLCVDLCSDVEEWLHSKKKLPSEDGHECLCFLKNLSHN